MKRVSLPASRAAQRTCIVTDTRVTAPDEERYAHAHDFAEVFWVDEGGGWEVINGRRRHLHPGDLAVLRPHTDAHRLHAEGERVFAIRNVAFPASLLDELAGRFFRGRTGFWGGTGPVPELLRLGEAQRARLNLATDRILAHPAEPLYLERMLLELLCCFAEERQSPFAGVPGWLADALGAMREPANFRQGASRLAALTGRSPEHVARVLKASCGLTPSAAVNRLRIEYAAAQLQSTDREILEIAYACGYQSISYFYTVFRRTYGTSPRRYRGRHHHMAAPYRLEP